MAPRMMRTLRLSVSTGLFLFTYAAVGQLSFGGVPFGLMEHGPVLPPAPVTTMPAVDHDAMLAEDEVRVASGVKGPYRFGFNHPTDLSLENSGTWHATIGR